MQGAVIVLIVAVVLIVLALVYYLVSTILQLRKITNGLDEVIGNVVEILEKTAPVNDVVTAINGQLDAGVDLLEGLLVKKAGLIDAVGLVDGLYPGAGAAGFRSIPGEQHGHGAAHRRGLHQGHAHAGAARPRGADRRREPRGLPAEERGGREPGRAPAVPGDPPVDAGVASAVAGHRHRRPGAVRAAGRHRRAAQAAARRTGTRSLSGAHRAR